MSGHSTADDWDPFSSDVAENQVHAYDRMRARCPVAYSATLGWSVFRHADVVTVAEDPATYSSRVSAEHPAVPSGFDPPQHTAYRALVQQFFTQTDVRVLEAPLRLIARELVDALPRGEAFDFIDRFALTFALRAQTAWLRWPRFAEVALRDWMARNQRASRLGDRDEITRIAQEFDRVIRLVVDDRRERKAAPNDVTARLLAARIDGMPLSDVEIVSILRNWTAGELGTVTAAVGILAHYLAHHPNLQHQLRQAPGGLEAAIDEILRIEPPLPSNRRVATRDVELCGREIRAGDALTIFWASANRDETVFGDPDRFQPEHNAQANVLYGRGPHVCPGAPLARLELRVALEALLSHTQSFRPDPRESAERAVHPGGGLRTVPLLIE